MNLLDELRSLVRKRQRKHQDRSKYKPHQGAREKERRQKGGNYRKSFVE